MRPMSWLLFVPLSCGVTPVRAQQSEIARKPVRAIRVAAGAITIDGRLAEPLGDMFHSIGVPGDHVLAVKTTFWISGR
jgi:hypothetical protein